MPNNDVPSNFDFIYYGKQVLDLEKNGICKLKKCINRDFQKIGELLLKCNGKIATMGIGKSGHIARKLSSTFSSTGSPSFFIHPTEAGHGDLGSLCSNDIVIAISNSGESKEIISLIYYLNNFNITYISITGNPLSTMSKLSKINLSIKVTKEACSLGLSPTTSSTAALVMGDALAISLSIAKGFNIKNFSFLHPGGILGKKLSLRVNDIMRKKIDVPIVYSTYSIFDTIVKITKKNFGIAVILNNNKTIKGVFNFKNLKKIYKLNLNLNDSISTVMNINFNQINPDILVEKAFKIMQSIKTDYLLVSIKNYFSGIIHINDIKKYGFY
ncbi:yrbH [Wigglesworthia glossinidia endosymbiont of Glossina brevipalpis]|uniref:Arabinose 5-phosphate isomerase n=1 Tax=Wigglesworthia glossinidia brevipalpis TaxID=36870 RepID=Q8D2M7_WIGBR|nr:yrbH [Wigglesworthia glossinidia endosymbiont of Glossina brevipalpis]